MAGAVLKDAILIDALPGDVRVAVLSAGRVTDLLVDRVGRPCVTGNIYRARVTALAPQIDAAFVDIGGDRAAFLGSADVPGDGRITEKLTEGQSLIVQALAEPRADAGGGKGAKVTAKPTLPGRLLVLTPGDGRVRPSRRIDEADRRQALKDLLDSLRPDADTGFVVRTEAATATDDDIVREAERLTTRWNALRAVAEAAPPPTCLHEDDAVTRAWRLAPAGSAVWFSGPDAADRVSAWGGEARVWTADEDLFAAHDADGIWAEAMAREVALPGGGSIVIEPTAALTAIDVNVGGANAGGAQATALAVNLEAMTAIAAHVRLRNLGGLFVIDAARLKAKSDRNRVLAALRGAGADDPAGLNVAGETTLGLFEMTRPRRRPALADVIGGACAACGAAGGPSAETAAFDALRRVLRESRLHPGAAVAVRAAADVAEALDGVAGEACRAVENRLGRTVDIATDPAMLPATYVVTETPR